MRELKNYINEQIHIAKLYKGNKTAVISFQERAYGAARFYDTTNKTTSGIKEFEKKLYQFKKLY